MIEGILIRHTFNAQCTLGEFAIFNNGARIGTWHTCENSTPGGKASTIWSKAAGATPIPLGTYQCKLTYSPKYQRQMWELQNVPGFAGIRIHSGNTSTDTLGCILLGKKIRANETGVDDSRQAMLEFENLMSKYMNPPFTLLVRVDPD